MMQHERAPRLEEQDHRLLALWAADCAERVLFCFEQHAAEDDRPRKALEAGRAWARGEIECGKARQAAFAAHAAARGANDDAAICAARAAGHAAATAHVGEHARHAAAYAIKAAAYAIKAAVAASAVEAAEHDWQRQNLPQHLRLIMFP